MSSICRSPWLCGWGGLDDQMGQQLFSLLLVCSFSYYTSQNVNFSCNSLEKYIAWGNYPKSFAVRVYLGDIKPLYRLWPLCPSTFFSPTLWDGELRLWVYTPKHFFFAIVFISTALSSYFPLFFCLLWGSLYRSIESYKINRSNKGGKNPKYQIKNLVFTCCIPQMIQRH